MVPVLPTVGTTTSTGFASSFTTGTLYSNAGVLTFNHAASYAATPVTWATTDNNGDAQGETPADSFYIKNLSLAKSVTNIKVTATITDVDNSDAIAADELVRIAVFTKDLGADGVTAASGNYLLRGVLSKSGGNTATGTVSNVAKTAAITPNGITATAAGTGFNICKIAGSDHALAPDSQVDVVIIVWMDGEALTDSTAGVEASIALTFSAVELTSHNRD